MDENYTKKVNFCPRDFVNARNVPRKSTKQNLKPLKMALRGPMDKVVEPYGQS